MPGTASLSVGWLGALRRGGYLSGLSIGVEAPLSKRLFVSANAGGFATETGVGPRDAQLGVGAVLVNSPTWVVRVMPGLSVPLGASAGANYAIVTTGSVDPTVSVSVVGGAAWLAIVNGYGRVPVHKGFDGVRQGAFASANAFAARRMAGGLVFAGPAVAGQFNRGSANPGFYELAGVLGCAFPITKKTAFRAAIRTPLIVDPPAYQVALQVGIRTTLGKPKKVTTLEEQSFPTGRSDDHQH